jgi:hypothetical protein
VGLRNGPIKDANGKVTSTINPDALSVPRVHEIYGGVERAIIASLTAGIDVVYREYTNQWEDIETNIEWNELGNSEERFRNGKSDFIYDLETPKEAQRWNFAGDLFVRKVLGDVKAVASYTYMHSEGTVNEGFATLFLDNPRQTKFYYGPLAEDRRHTIKISASYSPIEALSLGMGWNLNTGSPYDKLYWNDLFNAFLDRRAPRGRDPRSLSNPNDDVELRLPTVTQLDLKVSFDFKQWTGFHLEAIAEVFNVYNARTAVSLEERNLPVDGATQFGDVLARQEPFLTRFGVRGRY